MSVDPATTAGAVTEGEAMAAVDDGALVIADVARDDAWLSMPADAAPVLVERR